MGQASMGVYPCHERRSITGHGKDSSRRDEFIVKIQGILLVNILIAHHLWQAQKRADIDIHLPDKPENTFSKLALHGVEIGIDCSVETKT
jgi:hypothetical protein